MKVDLSKEKKELTMKQFHEIANSALDRVTQVCNEAINTAGGIQSVYTNSCDAALAILTAAHLRTIIMLFADQPESVSAFEVGVALNKMVEYIFETQLLNTSTASKLAYQRRLEDFLPEYLKVIGEKFENFGMEDIGV